MAEALMANEFVLPSLGDNVKAGDVPKGRIEPGGTVDKDKRVVERGTDKGTVEVPSALEGAVAEVRVKDGDRTDVGRVVFTIAGDGSAPAKAAPAAEPAKVAAKAV